MEKDEMEIERVEEKAIAPAPIVIPALEPDEVVRQFGKIQDLKRRLLDRTDIMTIGDKPYVLKSGWRKLAFAFNLMDEIVHEEREEREKGTVYRIWVRVTAPNGRSVVAVGSASSWERKFAHEEHDPYALAHTRAKNRAISDILGLGEVSAEEMAGARPEFSRPEVDRTEANGARKLVRNGQEWGTVQRTENGVEIIFNPPLELGGPAEFLFDKVLGGIAEAMARENKEFAWNSELDNDGRLERIVITGDLNEKRIRQIEGGASWTAAAAGGG